MPAGIDGNPNPLVTPLRTAVLEQVADQVDRGHTVVRSTTDLFHRPRVERMRLGSSSPDGYYEDSHQLLAIVADLLVPFRTGTSEVLVGAFDEPSDRVEPVR